MLNAVIRFSLQYRLMVITVSVVLLVYGSWLATQLPIDVFPDLDRPRVILITECPGLAAAEVETLVTQPIETAVLGAAGVQAVRSQTTSGLNVIYVEFDWNTDIRSARQTVQERLSVVRDLLPEGVNPQMTPPASIMGQFVIAGIYRQAGPHGGQLAVIPGTQLMAERIVRLDSQPELVVWKPGDRRSLNSWEEQPAENVTWQTDSDAAVTRRPSPEFVARARLQLRGREYTVDFGTPEQQQQALRTTADWVFQPRLRKTAGVAEVFIQGGEQRQYQVLVDPAALLEYDVTLQEVEQALRESNLNASGGFAVSGEIERPIRILGRPGPDASSILKELENIPVHVHEARAVLLKQVARVTLGSQFRRGDGAVNGQPGVVFTIVRQPHTDTRRLTDAVTAALAEVEATLPPDQIINSELFRLKGFIDRGIFNVAEALVIGAVLVVIVLFVFLLNFRTTFITLTAIPLSLVMTTLSFRLIGWLTGTPLSINVMTLGGLAVAMGELVDDAIVDVENIFRRLRENNRLAEPRPALLVVYEASLEIRSAIVFGTIVVILVFLPLFALSGVEGRLFAPLGAAYIVSILASLLVSLTVTPVMSYYLLPQSEGAHGEADGRVLRMLKRFAAPLIRCSLAYPRLLLVATWICVALASWQFSRMGRNFLPQFDEGSVQINVSLPPGSSLEASNRAAAAIDARLRSLQQTAERPDGEILHFVRRTGRAQLDEHAMPVSSSEYVLSMNPVSRRSREDTLASLLEQLREEVPGVDIEVEQPLAHMISHMVSGVYAQIAIRIYGDDLDMLQRLAEQSRAAIQDIPGLTPPVVEAMRQTPELQIRLRGDDLAFHGLTRAQTARILQTALQGEVVSEILEGQRRFDLLIRLEEASRTDYANLGRLRIDLPGGRGQVELREIADIEEGLGPSAVNRENARRRIVIRCNTRNRDLSSAVAEIQQRLRARVSLPEGYFVEYGGQFESQERASAMIMMLAGVSVAGMFVVLLLLFPSVRIVLQILNALPTAFIGGVAALLITRQDLTVASLVGFISLGGIAVRNGILLVTHYVHLLEHEGEQFTPAMILRGSLERLAPVLMTALTAGIGLIPLVLGGQAPGREILYPVATVILGGLVTSTFCEFLIHPGLFWKFSGSAIARLDERGQHRVMENRSSLG